MVRTWHPRGPRKMEIWSYQVVDKDTPTDVKQAMRGNLVRTFGPSGSLEQDDMNNWLQCTAAGSGLIGRKALINQQMGLGHEYQLEALPGALSKRVSETNQRAFYGFWAQVMNAPSWDQIKLDPRTRA